VLARSGAARRVQELSRRGRSVGARLAFKRLDCAAPPFLVEAADLRGARRLRRTPRLFPFPFPFLCLEDAVGQTGARPRGCVAGSRIFGRRSRPLLLYQSLMLAAIVVYGFNIGPLATKICPRNALKQQA
jgi:hypothetical protein